MTTEQAQAELSQIKQLFRFLSDTPDLYTQWENIVSQYAVSGRTRTTLAWWQR
jgi:hypothetical protein